MPTPRDELLSLDAPPLPALVLPLLRHELVVGAVGLVVRRRRRLAPLGLGGLQHAVLIAPMTTRRAALAHVQRQHKQRQQHVPHDQYDDNVVLQQL